MAKGTTDAAVAATAYLLLWFSILYLIVRGGRKLAWPCEDSSHGVPRYAKIYLEKRNNTSPTTSFPSARPSRQCATLPDKSEDDNLKAKQLRDTAIEPFS
jgi:hypothetical protein